MSVAPPPNQPTKSSKTTIIVLAVIGMAALLFVALAIASFMWVRSQQKQQEQQQAMMREQMEQQQAMMEQQQERQAVMQERQAMITVYNQNRAALAVLATVPPTSVPPGGARGRGPQPPMGAKFDQAIANMRAINLTGCPQDFQKTYIAVIKAFEQVGVEAKTLTGVPGLARVISEGAHLDFKSETDDLRSVNEAVTYFKDAMLDLDQCARSHGLTITPASAPGT